jgi:phage terminase large subunit
VSAKNSPKLRVAKIFQPLFTDTRRKNILRGGRGSAKSWVTADYCITRAIAEPTRILCTREFQKTISESVHNLLSKRIEDLGVRDAFKITNNKITCSNGSEFIFAGIRTNVDEIKSMEGIDICWVEEAQNMSQYSLDILIPTIRKEGSILVFTFNPFKDTDPVYALSETPDEDTLVITANYDDNPFFPDVLRKEMERDKQMDWDKYEWVWLGKCKGVSAAQIFKGKYKVETFDTPDGVQFYYGADWGFSSDPAAIIRSYIVGNTLYIDYTAGGVGIDLDDLPSMFNSIPGSRLHPIPADRSRPETIAHMKNRGYNVYGAEVWNGSVEDGIEYLKNFDMIVVHPRCTQVIEEFEFYQYKVDRQTNAVLPIIVDRYNHWIDALRYSHVNRMRSVTSGSVYKDFNMKSLTAPFEASGTVFTGTFASPGRVLTISAVAKGGAFFILSDYAMNGILDFDKLKERFPRHVSHIWFPMLVPEEVPPILLQQAWSRQIEPAIGPVFPAEGEGTDTMNKLFSNKSLFIVDNNYSLIGALTERAYRLDGMLETQRTTTELVRMCELAEYTIWRMAGRMAA